MRALSLGRVYEGKQAAFKVLPSVLQGKLWSVREEVVDNRSDSEGNGC